MHYVLFQEGSLISFKLFTFFYYFSLRNVEKVTVSWKPIRVYQYQEQIPKYSGGARLC